MNFLMVFLKKQWLRLLLFLIFPAAFCGCTAQAPTEGYTVMFESTPKLTRTGITYNGQQIGSVLSTETGPGDIAKMTVALDDDFIGQTGYAIVFCARRGGLEVERLRTVGDPMRQDDIFYGFASGSGLTWFKIKTIVGNRVRAVRKEAQKLHRRFESAPRKMSFLKTCTSATA